MNVGLSRPTIVSARALSDMKGNAPRDMLTCHDMKVEQVLTSFEEATVDTVCWKLMEKVRASETEGGPSSPTGASSCSSILLSDLRKRLSITSSWEKNVAEVKLPEVVLYEETRLCSRWSQAYDEHETNTYLPCCTS